PKAVVAAHPFPCLAAEDWLFLGVGAAQHLPNLPRSCAAATNKQVFASYNLQNTDSNFALLMEKRIKEEIEAFPEKF
ncbi:hypothetical protein HPG69_000582, partial [Diceros bicornis minor]